jgi:hypothetical protein
MPDLKPLYPTRDNAPPTLLDSPARWRPAPRQLVDWFQQHRTEFVAATREPNFLQFNPTEIAVDFDAAGDLKIGIRFTNEAMPKHPGFEIIKNLDGAAFVSDCLIEGMIDELQSDDPPEPDMSNVGSIVAAEDLNYLSRRFAMIAGSGHPITTVATADNPNGAAIIEFNAKQGTGTVDLACRLPAGAVLSRYMLDENLPPVYCWCVTPDFADKLTHGFSATRDLALLKRDAAQPAAVLLHDVSAVKPTRATVFVAGRVKSSGLKYHPSISSKEQKRRIWQQLEFIGVEVDSSK